MRSFGLTWRERNWRGRYLILLGWRLRRGCMITLRLGRKARVIWDFCLRGRRRREKWKRRCGRRMRSCGLRFGRGWRWSTRRRGAWWGSWGANREKDLTQSTQRKHRGRGDASSAHSIAEERKISFWLWGRRSLRGAWRLRRRRIAPFVLP